MSIYSINSAREIPKITQEAKDAAERFRIEKGIAERLVKVFTKLNGKVWNREKTISDAVRTEFSDFSTAFYRGRVVEIYQMNGVLDYPNKFYCYVADHESGERIDAADVSKKLDWYITNKESEKITENLFQIETMVEEWNDYYKRLEGLPSSIRYAISRRIENR